MFIFYQMHVQFKRGEIKLQFISCMKNKVLKIKHHFYMKYTLQTILQV